MSLKQWLAQNRKPEYCGINARSMLKRCVKRVPTYSELCFDLAVNAHDPELKQLLFRFSRESR